MTTSKGLGKGLGALISMFDEDNDEFQKTSATMSQALAKPSPQPASKPATVSVASGVSEVDISLIDNNVNQPRKNFDPLELDELAGSIKTNGVLSPILLTQVGSRYMIVAGERRWRAAQRAGLKSIPAIVRNYTPRQVSEIALVENLQRSDLNEIEVAAGIKKLMDQFYMTQEQVANCLGKPRATVANTLRLLNLPKEVQTLIQNNEITPGHAKCLVAITADARLCIQLARQAAGGKLTVRGLEEIINRTNKPKTVTATTTRSVELKDLSELMTRTLSTKVTIAGSVQKGKIIIEYNSTSDLERIKSKLGK